MDHWQTDTHTGKHALKHTETGTLTHIPECYQYNRHACGTESRGMALRHSLNMQQAILNKQENWMERVGVRARVKKKETDWLGICLKEKVRATQCLSDWGSAERGKKKGSEEKKSRQAYRSFNRPAPAKRHVKGLQSKHCAALLNFLFCWELLLM